MNLNIVTFLRTLLTMFSWLILMLLIYDSYVVNITSLRYDRYSDGVYRSNLPYHTY